MSIALLLAGACGPRSDAKVEAAAARLPRGVYQAGGVTVSYLHAGTKGGRRVIFVHGTPGDATAWAAFLLAVPPGFEFFAVDRPGFGQSRPLDAEPSLARQAAALTPLLASATRPAILVGHSLGGPIIARLAADHPDRVGGLIILAGALDPAQERVLPIQYAGEWWGIRTLVPTTLRNANRELIALKGELETLESRLDRITAPVVIVHGTKDDLVPFANVGYMRPRFSRARSIRTIALRGQNHFLPWNEKPLIDRLIRELSTS